MTRVPPFCERGAEPPRSELFRRLRRAWGRRHPDGGNREIADLLGTKIQNVSNWSNGTGDKRPPWWVVMRLCHELQYEIVMDGSRIVVQPKEEE